MPAASRLATTLLLCSLSLLSAFLLFQVQPVISKFILPWFGGSPGVWTTCMLFFQVVLFLGYAYAHGLTRLPRRWQWLIHGILVVAALSVLPLSPSPDWKPTGNEDPATRILLLLLATVALPYFVLSSTSPLTQVWFTRAVPGGHPWRLYALSNLGSLAALLSYPFLIEPKWNVLQQTQIWSGAFVAFVLLSLGCVFLDWRRSASAPDDEARKDSAPDIAPRWWQRLLWVLLPAMASLMLLASTNHVCQDVAVIPFLWVVPLSLYLITFIICFEHERWYQPVLWALPAMVAVFVAIGFMEIPDKTLNDNATLAWIGKALNLGTPGDYIQGFRGQLLVCFTAMFLACMVCHGELTRLKPASRHLTEFYLLMSAGGALGGLFVSLLAPQLFSTYVEWPVVLMLTFILAAAVVLRSVWRLRRRWMRVSLATTMVAALVAGERFMLDWGFDLEPRIERVRNFYGAVSVEDDWFDEAGAYYRRFHHGGIIHGVQLQSPEGRTEPMSYYGRETGIGRALLSLNNRSDARVGVVGMGTATTAAYGMKGQTYRFYDINPDIVRIAQKQFTFVSDLEARGGKVEVVMGDARLSMEREPPQNFDVLLLDAFSGDSVPVHLLTLEAFQIYQRHMKPDGIIAVHVSNRYLTLSPVVERVAKAVGMKTARYITEAEDDQEFTDYMVVTNNDAFLKANPTEDIGYEIGWEARLWTDQDHNLFEILDRD